MKGFAVSTFVGLAAVAQASELVARQSSGVNQQYINSVCSPSVTNTNGQLPPCISITNIETQCQPNGTQPIDYLASAQCICNAPSTFFADWQGCRQCLFRHGALDQQDVDTFSVIISSASQALCTGTPTAEFAAIFSSVANTVARVTTGATISSDQFPSSTAVSLYYTAPGSQGPGVISGAALSATKASSAGAATTSASRSSSGSVTVLSGTSVTTTASTSSKATSSSGSSTGSSAAAPTRFDGKGLLAAVAGGVLLFAV